MNVMLKIDTPVTGIGDVIQIREALSSTLKGITTSGHSVATVRYEIIPAFLGGGDGRSVKLEMDGVATPGLLCQLIDNICLRMPVFVPKENILLQYEGDDYGFNGRLADWDPWKNWTTFGPVDWSNV